MKIARSGFIPTFFKSHKRLKRKCWKRDNYVCQLRIHPDCPVFMFPLWQKYLAGKITRKKALLTVDHEPPLSRGGTWDLKHMRTACSLCNRMKGDKTDKELEELLED